jgi:hypothetical protein
MTAGEVVDRIRKNVGVPWRETTAQWIGSFVTEVPVRLVTAGEPFWAPR